MNAPGDASRDRLFADPGRALVDFAFDTDVVAVFPDMIRRSVPGYETVIPLTALFAATRVRAGAGLRVYDLGCSLGASSLAVAERLGDNHAEIIAVDNSPAMIDRGRALIADPRVRFMLADITTLTLHPCGAVLLNYVLQFVPPDSRLTLLRRIRAALNPGGCLIVSGKIRADDADEQAFFETAHLDFKRANGYSELEISGKRSALEQVMIVATEEEHRALFRAAGFSTVRKWYQCLNWASFIVEP
ncbi:MAG: carboxy-S-adenosyl-L-methionine synthase CmoA [Pseudomonadales bacterium]